MADPEIARRELLERRKARLAAFASVQIPDIVMDDIRRTHLNHRVLVQVDANGRMDVERTMMNVGALVAFSDLLEKVERARSGRAIDEIQTRAVSETAEASS